MGDKRVGGQVSDKEGTRAESSVEEVFREGLVRLDLLEDRGEKGQRTVYPRYGTTLNT